MCIIIENKDGRLIDPFISDRATTINPDGYTRLDLRDMSIIKTLNMVKAERIMNERIPAIHHARYATVGNVTTDNLHPFPVDDQWLLFMNGTVEGMKCQGRETDSARLAKALAHVAPERYAEFLANFDARFTLVNKDTKDIVNVGDFIEHEGMRLSKADVLPTHRVAVYGTLKRAHGNHHLLREGKARFLGVGKTKDIHRMPSQTSPTVYKGPSKEGQGARITVEVYEVTSTLLTGPLDKLEGHPDWYRREQVPIVMSVSGRIETAWLYFMREDHGYFHSTKDTSQTGPFYECYFPEADKRFHEPHTNSRVRVKGYHGRIGHSMAFADLYEQMDHANMAVVPTGDIPFDGVTREDIARARKLLKEQGVDVEEWDDMDIMATIMGGLEMMPSGPRCPRCDTHMDEDDNWVWCDECGHFQHISRHDRSAQRDLVEGL